MTEPTTSGADRPQPLDLDAAVTGLEQLKAMLQRAGRGEAEAGEVPEAVTGYLRDHKDTLTAAATAVGQEVRSQLLAELYRWRAQLQASGRPARSPPRSSDS